MKSITKEITAEKGETDPVKMKFEQFQDYLDTLDSRGLENLLANIKLPEGRKDVVLARLQIRYQQETLLKAQEEMMRQAQAMQANASVAAVQPQAAAMEQPVAAAPRQQLPLAVPDQTAASLGIPGQEKDRQISVPDKNQQIALRDARIEAGLTPEKEYLPVDSGSLAA